MTGACRSPCGSQGSDLSSLIFDLNVDSFQSTLDQPVVLPVFEGPLDLLLFLIRRNEVDIYDIPIGEITRQYLEILHGMERLRLDVAGDFIVMAATLMQIKSRLLVPVDQRGEDSDDDAQDPRWELVQQLLEYQRFKQAAGELEALANATRDVLPRIASADPADAPPQALRPVSGLDVWAAFNAVLRRLAERMTVGDIDAETVTVADRMEVILERIARQPRLLFTTLFDNAPLTPGLLAATFLAVLELTRLGRLELSQDGAFADIEMRRGKGP